MLLGDASKQRSLQLGQSKAPTPAPWSKLVGTFRGRLRKNHPDNPVVASEQSSDSGATKHRAGSGCETM